MLLSIIIPNYNNYDLLKKCIDSILPQIDSNSEIIIIDNGSINIDNTNYFKTNIKESNIKFIFFAQGLGFSKAVNIGIKQAKGTYIAILNNDTELSPEWIKNIILTFEQNTVVMYVTSKIKSLPSKGIFDDVGDVLLSSGKVHKIGNGEKNTGQYDEQKIVFGASGCASAYRREFFSKVGYFDEDFFAYLEDIDLSFRAFHQGLNCLYVPDAVVYHLGSATTGSKYNKFTAFYLAQNTINVIVKNYPLRIIAKSFLSIISHLLMLQVFCITKGLGISFFKGFLSGIKMSKKMLFKRKEIMQKRTLSDLEIQKMFRENKKLYKISKSRRIKLL